MGRPRRAPLPGWRTLLAQLDCGWRAVDERGLGLGSGVFEPCLFELVASGILAAATLWYERGRDPGPAEFGEAGAAIR